MISVAEFSHDGEDAVFISVSEVELPKDQLMKTNVYKYYRVRNYSTVNISFYHD